MVSLKKQLALRKTVFKKEKKKRALIEIVFYKHIKKLSAFKYFKCTQKCAQMGKFSAHISLKIFFSLSSSKSLNFLNLIVPLFLRIHTPRPKLSCHQSFKSDLDITQEEAPSLPEVSLLLQHTKKQSIMGPC